MPSSCPISLEVLRAQKPSRHWSCRSVRGHSPRLALSFFILQNCLQTRHAYARTPPTCRGGLVKLCTAHDGSMPIKRDQPWDDQQVMAGREWPFTHATKQPSKRRDSATSL